MAFSSYRVLVVDDVQDNRELITQRLLRFGFERYATAVDGQDALDKLRAEKFDIVLLDIMMPVMDGIAVLEHMKDDPALNGIPVVVVSAVGEQEQVQRCIKLGAKDYLLKPVDHNLLRTRIEATLVYRALEDEERLHAAARAEAEAYKAEVEVAKREATVQRKRAAEYLIAVMPAPAAAEMLETNTVAPRLSGTVAVLFADVPHFDELTKDLPAEESARKLGAIIDRLEDIARDAGLERTKTQGSAFMATAGLFKSVEEPVLKAVRCGMAMAAPQEADNEQELPVRVAIHYGPVPSGMVGHRHGIFDVWGETVTTAARLNANAEPGCVELSQQAWGQVASVCTGERRGRFEVRGQGEIDVYRCEGCP